MKKDQSTMEWVKTQLAVYGKITRNQAMIAGKTHRLAEYIRLLRNEYWPIKEGYYKKTKNGKDFVYEMEQK
jgi:hypothetical protein